MAKTIAQIQAMITAKLDAREIINEIADYLQANPGGGGAIASVVAGSGIGVDNTDPANPVISSTGGSSYLVATYAEIVSAIAADELVPGTLYQISDRGDRGLFFTAISVNQLAKDGARLMLCPARYSLNETDGDGNVWKGVWSLLKDPDVNDLMIRGGKVWKNLTGNIGTSANDVSLDAVNWVVIPKASFSNNEYVEKEFGVRFDIVNDWIEKQWDANGNVFGIDYVAYQWYDGTPGLNYCDMSDWNHSSNAEGNTMFNNTGLGVWNNASANICFNIMGEHISNNSNTYNISFNVIIGYIKNNSNQGDIYGNYVIDIESNSNGGNIKENHNNGIIGSNSNTGQIDYNMNNGNIQTIGAANANITKNINNGNIATTTTGDISDSIVNK